jgi:hypothetical protein
MSVRSQEDINLRADRNINIEAGQNINTKAVAGKINIEAQAGVFTKSNAKVQIDAAATYSVKSTNFNVADSGDTSATGKIVASGIMFAPDFKTPGVGLIGHIHGNSPPPSQAGGSSGAVTGSTVSPIPKTSKTNVKSGFAGTTSVTVAGQGAAIPNYWSRETESIETIVSRLMTYEPCPEHVNKGQ